jgi:hypothetical protein
VTPEHFPDALPSVDYRERARFRQLRGRHGIGVAVQQAVFSEEPGRRWLCIATDGTRYRHLEAVAPDLSDHAGVPPEAVESALEERAADYPERARLAALVNASPVVLDVRSLGGER